MDIKNHVFTKEKEVYMFVFNDMVMLSKKTFKKPKARQVEKPAKPVKRLSADAPETLRYSHQINIPLKDTILIQNPGKDNESAEFPITIAENITDQDRCFGLVSPSKEVFVFKANSVMDKRQWLNIIHKAFSEAQKKISM